MQTQPKVKSRLEFCGCIFEERITKTIPWSADWCNYGYLKIDLLKTIICQEHLKDLLNEH